MQLEMYAVYIIYTDVVIFIRRYKSTTTRTLELRAQRLEISKRAKYLGVILDNKLTWKDHFDSKYKVSLSTMEDWKVGRAHLPGNGENWFADGSKNREGAGASVYG